MLFFPSCCWIELGFTSGLSSGNFGAIVCETFQINGPFGGKCQTRSNEPWLSWWMGGLPLKESWVAIKTDSINYCKPHQATNDFGLAMASLCQLSMTPLAIFFFSWTNEDHWFFSASGSHQGNDTPQHGPEVLRCYGHTTSQNTLRVWVSIPNTPKIMLSRSHFNMTTPILATSGLRDAEKQQGTVPRTHQWQVQKHTRWRRTIWRRGSWEMGDLRLMRTPFDA